MNNTSWYQEELLEHYRNPKNKKIISPCDFSSEEHNPSCGDAVCIMGTIKNNIIDDLGFQGKGCVISQASASMLTELCIGKTLEDVKNLTEDTIITMLGIQLGPVRIKCALLSLFVLQQGINSLP